MTAINPPRDLAALRSQYEQTKDLVEKLQKENLQLTEQVKRLSKTEIELYGIQAQLDTQMQFYQQLYEVGKQFTTTTELPDILQIAVRFVLYELNFERCLVLMYSAEEKAFRVQALDGYYDEDQRLAVAALRLPEDDPILLQVLQEPHRLICTEACQQEPLLALARKFALDEYILLPLGGEPDIPLGFLAAGNTAAMRAFQARVQPDGESDVALASLVSHTAAAINNLNFYQALRENEKKYRTLFEDSRDAIFIGAPTGEMLDVNQAMLELFGQTRAAMQLTSWDIFVNPDERATFQQAIEQTGSVRDFEVKLQKKNGTQMDCLLTATGRRADDGPIVAYQGIVRDITQRKRVEADLRQHQEHLEELVAERTAELAKATNLAQQSQKAADDANAAKSSFLANMSHELRTPMSAVIGMTHLAMQTELTSKQRDYLSKIQSSAHSLLGIINDILDFSKIEAGKLDMESVDFNLDEVLENLTNLITVKAQEKKDLEVLVALDPEVPRLLVGDPLRLGQVLINLANNAVKFTESGEIVLSAELLTQEADRVILKFSVRDTGVGLTREQIARLFQAFTQADASTTRKFGGTGLGLTISKRLVNLMHGEIWVESEPGRGSNFMFTAAFGRGRKKEPDRFKPAPSLRGMKVLVVDDNATSREILQAILASFSFEASLASSGEESLTEIENADKSHPYELVIMDYKMPGMDGIEAARRIKQHPHLRRIPAVVMVTNYGGAEVMKKADEAGLDGFLLKPVTPSVLFDAIMQAVGKEVPKPSPAARESAPEMGQLPHIRGARVLLVEDNEINQQVAKEILEAAGLRVSLANNGQEAVDALPEGSYDVVLMDVQMPVMDGYEATRKIRSNPQSKDLPIIAMTAHALAGDREKSLEAGMNDHVSKPIDPAILFQTLEKWVKRPAPEAAGQEGAAAIELKTFAAPDDALDFPKLEGINVPAGLQRLLGNQKSYRRILLKFRRDLENAADRLQDLVFEEKYREAEILCHSIKGAGANIGAEGLQGAAAALERWFKNGGRQLPEPGFTKFERELHRVLTSLSALEEAQEPSPPPAESSAPLPPEIATEIAGRLRNAVEVGDVTELSEIAAELTARTDGSSPYGARIGRLTENFDFDGLVQLADTLEEAAR